MQLLKDFKKKMKDRDKVLDDNDAYRRKLWLENLDLINNNLSKFLEVMTEMEHTTNTLGARQDCGTPASAADPTYSDFWWTPGLGRPPYPLRDLPHFHGSPRTWDLGLKHQILTKWVPTEL